MADLVASFGGRLVPVVVLADADRAEGLADALVAGGLHVAEVTFRTPAAAEAIRRMAKHPDLVVGAGTVIRAEQVDQAADAGARFIVSPGLSQPVVARARERGVDVLPGAMDELAYGGRVTAENLGDHVVRLGEHLAQHERRPFQR